MLDSGRGLFTTEVRCTWCPTTISFSGSISNLLLSLLLSAMSMLSKFQPCSGQRGGYKVILIVLELITDDLHPDHYSCSFRVIRVKIYILWTGALQIATCCSHQYITHRKRLTWQVTYLRDKKSAEAFV